MILFVSNADTELLAVRVAAERLPEGFPKVVARRAATLVGVGDGSVPEAAGLARAQAVIVRLLGGRDAWRAPFEHLAASCAANGVPLLAFGGESIPDADLAQASTVPPAIAGEAFRYLVQGGAANLEQLLRFVADTVLMEGYGFDPPAEIPMHGLYQSTGAASATGPPDGSGRRARIGVVFYRAHLLAGNTSFVDDLCQALARRGAEPVPVYTYSLRAASSSPTSTRNDRSGPSDPSGPSGVSGPESESTAIDLLAEADVDVVVVTTLAAGSLSEQSDNWDPGALAGLDVPVVQAICATSPSAAWEASTIGLTPVDVAMSVAIPEFDGRIISVPFSFKEIVDQHDEVVGTPLTAYRTRGDRLERVAELALRLARLRQTPPGQRRIAVVLSAYPTKRSRLGNAVGLDTPASVVALLDTLRSSGYAVDRVPSTGDDLMAELADTLVYDDAGMPATTARRELRVGELDAPVYAEWFATLPASLRNGVTSTWGEPPGEIFVDATTKAFAFSGLDLGSVVVAVQPPRGFGANPVAVYHSPDLAPTHHYLAFYRWIDAVFGAHAIVHVGKHGTLEWLPGKGVGLSAGCAPDAALGSVPLVYPFVVNDPGEGAQAKRRSHAVIVDHLVPPLVRADVYDDLARLESLLDEHARLLSLDPSKLPAIRRRVWDCIVGAEIHRDLGLSHGAPAGYDDPAFDDLMPEVDGYLCELKDAQIRGGLHVLGAPPVGDAEVDLVLALTRVPQGRVASLRAVVAEQLGIAPGTMSRTDTDRLESACRELVADLQSRQWTPPAPTSPASPGVREVVGWICTRLVPALRATTGEIDAILHALDGGAVPPGPSGAPSRGQAHVLPTGRNFYTIDPRGVPSRLAWEVGVGLADRLIERHVAETGALPRTVGIVVWGTSAMRTAGDDIAQALSLLGVRPCWAEGSSAVTGLEAIALEELGRPRVDVTLRVSGFFRDAFPHVIGLFDDAVTLVAALDENDDDNPVRASGTEDPRIFGPKPGAYGSGILELLESRHWRSDEDLAAVYLAWGGWSYGRAAMGAPAPDAIRRRLAAVEVATKNQDNREHDIFDSDDYLQDHGGMIAAIRALTGRRPLAFFGDSSDPARPRVRTLAEEAARVVRTRVVNPKWIAAMQRHGYKGAFEMAATVDYLFGYDATAHVVEDWMYEKVTESYVADPAVRKFFEASNPWALRSIAERLLEATERGMWDASPDALRTLRSALLEAEGWEESR